MVFPRPRPPERSTPASCGTYRACCSCWMGPVALPQGQGRIRRYAAGADLAAQGEPPADILTLIEGWLLLSALLSDGRSQILHIVVERIEKEEHPLNRIMEQQWTGARLKVTTTG